MFHMRSNNLFLFCRYQNEVPESERVDELSRVSSAISREVGALARNIDEDDTITRADASLVSRSWSKVKQRSSMGFQHGVLTKSLLGVFSASFEYIFKSHGVVLHINLTACIVILKGNLYDMCICALSRSAFNLNCARVCVAFCLVCFVFSFSNYNYCKLF